MKNYYKFLLVIWINISMFSKASEPDNTNIYESPRIGRLLKVSRLNEDSQSPMRYMRILNKQGGECDIGRELNAEYLKVIRIWSFGESIDRLRTIYVMKDGSAKVTVKFYPSQPEENYELKNQEYLKISKMIKEIVAEPIAFKITSIISGSSGVNYVLEDLSAEKYSWAIREADYSPTPKYLAVGEVVNLLRTKEAK